MGAKYIRIYSLMPMYLDTRGNTTLAVAICARCSVKYPHDQLRPDPNSPGLMCCPDGCLDVLDPWRLPQRSADRLALEWARPDVALPVGPQAIAINQPQAVINDNSGPIGDQNKNPITIAGPVTQINPSQPWSARTAYGLGAQVTPTNPVGLGAAGNLFAQFLCIVPGTSGATAPAWTQTTGTVVTDGTVIWYCEGLYLP